MRRFYVYLLLINTAALKITEAYLSTHTVYLYKKKKSLFWGDIGKWIQENINFMRFCCCVKQSKKIEKAADTHHCQMHTDWPSAIG